MLEEEVKHTESLRCSSTELTRHNIPGIKRFEYFCAHPESNCSSIKIIGELNTPLCGYYDNGAWPYF